MIFYAHNSGTDEASVRSLSFITIHELKIEDTQKRITNNKST